MAHIAPEVVTAELLDHVEYVVFPCLNKSSPVPETLLVVGGIHGNEIRGIAGAQHMVEYFRNAACYELARHILSRVRVVVIPILNRIGYLAAARTCPTPGTHITLLEGKVQIGADERGSLKMPKGWADPNVGWENNNTLAMWHLKEAITMFCPTMIIFNHDWAAPQGICKNYGPKENLTLVNKVTDTFARYYPSRTPFGRQWKFLIQAGQDGEGAEEEDPKNMTWGLFHQGGVPSFVLETYLHENHDNRLHLEVGLFILGKFAKVLLEDDELNRLVAIHS